MSASPVKDVQRFVLSDEGNALSILRPISAAQAVVRLGNWLTARGGAVSQEVMDELVTVVAEAGVYASTRARLDAPRSALEELLHARLVISLDAEQREALARPAPLLCDGVDVALALWRRAEGVTLSLDPTAPSKPIQARVAAHGADAECAMEVSREGVRVLCALTRWERARDIAGRLGVDEAEVGAWLRTFAMRGLAVYADFDCGRTFPGETRDGEQLERPLALLDSVAIAPVLDRHGRSIIGPFMPRKGELDGIVGRGARLETLRRAKTISTVEICGDPDVFRALRAIIPRLDGRETARSIIDSLPADLVEVGRRALGLLGDTGLLEEVEVRAAPSRKPVATATWLGHASVMVSFGDQHIWVDPTLPRASHQALGHSPAVGLRRALPRPSAVLITHGDNDHLAWSELVRLATSTPMYFPSTEGAGPFQVDIPGVLRCMGFTRLHPMSPWECARIGEVEIIAAPFEGEDWGLALRTSTWLVEGPARSRTGGTKRGRVYLSADSEGMLTHAPRLRERGPIDLAFLGVSGAIDAHVSAPGFGYGEFYRRWLPRERWMRLTRLTNGPREAAVLAKALEARRVFGYAAGTPGEELLSYCDEGSHADLAALLEETDGVKPIDLELGRPWEIVVE